jgi:hypothetical protein
MKRLLLNLVLIGLCASISFGEVDFDYVISDTYVGGYTLNGLDSLLVTGAGALFIDAFGESYVEVQNTAPLQENIGGIYDLNLNDFSTMNYYNGETNLFDIRGDATATFSGGRIDYIRSFQDSDVMGHITFVADLDSIDLTGNLLTGNWLNDSSFSITLQDQTGYDSVYSNINFVPEPATLLLFGLGGLLLRKKR